MKNKDKYNTISQILSKSIHEKETYSFCREMWKLKIDTIESLLSLTVEYNNENLSCVHQMRFWFA